MLNPVFSIAHMREMSEDHSHLLMSYPFFLTVTYVQLLCSMASRIRLIRCDYLKREHILMRPTA